MADISILLRLVNGVNRNVDISANTLVTTSIKVGGLTPTELTKTILDKLINLQNGTDFSDGTNAHTHDGRYYTETELGSQADGASGASKIGIDVTPAFTNFTSGSTVQSALEGIDAALGTASVVEFLDSTFRIKDDGDNTKKIAFQASGIATATTRTITMPDADVDLGALTNSNISASAAIAYSKLNLSASIVNADIAAGAAIAESKLSLDYSTSSLNTAIGTKVSKAGDTMSGNLAMGGNKVTGLGTPTADSDAATKAYVDAIQSGLDVKQSVRLATTAALAANTAAGSGVGKTLTADANGALSVDGVAVAVGNRILVKDETPASDNGIYVVTDAGSAGTPYILTRAADFDQDAEVTAGAFMFVAEGSTWADTGWVLSTNDPITVDTTSLAFTQFSAAGQIVAGAGLTKTGNTLDVVSANTGILANADSIELNLAASSGLEISSGLKVAASIAGSALALTSGVLDVQVDNSTIEVNADALRLKALGITDSHISASAAIAYSKLALSNSIVNADIAAGAAIAYSKLALTNSIVLGDLTVNSVDENKLTASVAGAGLTGGGGSALSVVHSPMVKKTFVAGEAFAANTSFAVRIALTGETAGRVYGADKDASVSDKFYAIGMIEGNGAAAKIAGDNVDVVLMGTITLGSSDVAFAAGEVGQAVHLLANGAWDAVSQITYVTNEASYRLGMVQETNKILVGHMQLLGVN